MSITATTLRNDVARLISRLDEVLTLRLTKGDARLYDEAVDSFIKVTTVLWLVHDNLEAGQTPRNQAEYLRKYQVTHRDMVIVLSDDRDKLFARTVLQLCGLLQ
jgi:hypothetical protein